MRLLVANHHGALHGGIETYLAAVMPALAQRGCEILFAHEEPIAAQAPIASPLGIPSSLMDKAGLTSIHQWSPNLAYVHAMNELQIFESIARDFPTVAFAHGYWGLCISGAKTWKRQPARPCSKPFDWRCLFYYFPKNCGGSSPITMLREYRKQSRRLALYRRCDALITHAGPMEREYLAQGIPKEKLFALPHFVPTPKPQGRPIDSQYTNLLFIGRFDFLKGGHLLIEALPEVAARLNKAILLRMVGAGPAGPDLKRQAQQISSDKIHVEFPGWVGREQKDAFIAESDLIVVPSVWPEPFGQVGLEANHLGVPAIAFDAGGISNWLREGINGHLAPSNPPNGAALANAITKALGNPEHYARLRAGARAVAAEFTVDRHVSALLAVFEKVLERRRK